MLAVPTSIWPSSVTSALAVCGMCRIQQSSSSSKLPEASTLWLSGPGSWHPRSSSVLPSEREAAKQQRRAMVQAAQKQL